MEFMKLTQNQAKQISALKRMKDEDIAFTDIPELTGDEKFVVGKSLCRTYGACKFF